MEQGEGNEQDADEPPRVIPDDTTAQTIPSLPAVPVNESDNAPQPAKDAGTIGPENDAEVINQPE